MRKGIRWAKVSSYTSWQPLEEVIVGRAYTPDYFDFIEDATSARSIATHT